MITADAINTYAAQVFEMRALLATLTEFVDLLPAPEDDEIPGVHWGHLGSLNQIHTQLTVASEIASEMFD
jgi:hypothetical protein